MGFQHFEIALKKRISGLAVFVGVVSASALILAGCNVATNDSTSDKGPLKMTLPQEACLNEAAPIITDYFRGNGSVDSTNSAFNCLSGAIDKFVTSTKGANPTYFTSRELRTFVETYYLTNMKVSDQLLTQVMRVKQLLVGGSDDRLTKAELDSVQGALQTVRVEALRLLPYINIYALKISSDDAQKNPALIEAALSAFITTTSNVGNLLGKGSEPYATEDLQTLLQELKPLFKDWSGPADLIEYLPTFGVVKSLVLKPPGNRIAPSEWAPLLSSGGRVYALYMRQRFLMNNANLMSGVGLEQLSKMIEELYSIVRGGVDAKPAKVIPYALFDAAIDEAMRLELIDARLRDTTMKGMLRTVFGKLLNPATAGGRSRVTGLNANVLSKLHDEAVAFVEMQRAYAVVMGSRTTPMTVPEFAKAFSVAHTNAPYAQEDLRRLMTLASPLSYRDNGTVIFDNRASQLILTEKAFARYNWQSIASRLLVQGYATDAQASKWTGLTALQLKSFFSDVHDLGADLEILEPKDDDLWQTSFNEANMFMLSADNDGLMSYSEVFDYLAYLLGGGVMSDRMYNDTKEHCAHIGVDSFSRPTMDIACFRQRYYQQFPNVHAELPTWVAVVKKGSLAGWPDFEQSLEKAARTKGFSDDPISTSDLTRMTMVQQYIESLFVRFDANRDGFIDYNEGLKALPLFKALLVQASGFAPDSKKITALYFWILDKGKAPTSIGDKISFLIWTASSGNWKAVKADRLKLMSVVGALKSASATAAALEVSGDELPGAGVNGTVGIPGWPVAN